MNPRIPPCGEGLAAVLGGLGRGWGRMWCRAVTRMGSRGGVAGQGSGWRGGWRGALGSGRTITMCPASMCRSRSGSLTCAAVRITGGASGPGSREAAGVSGSGSAVALVAGHHPPSGSCRRASLLPLVRGPERAGCEM
jgi:hypothetical protein